MRPQEPEHSEFPNLAPIDRRDFLRESVAAAAGGAVALSGTALASAAPTAAASPTSIAIPASYAEPKRANSAVTAGKMGIGVNLEYVRHADKSLTYGVKLAGKIGYKYVEPCFLMGRCLLSNGGYCHVTSLDTDPKEIRDLMDGAGVKISALSAHSDILDPEWGVLYARRAIRYAKAVGTDIVQITENMYPPPWMTEEDAYAIMKITLRAISETCAENGVYLGVEQHGPYTARIPRMKRILELVESPWIKVNYDCGNTFLSGSDPYEMLEMCIDRVIHVHAKDISVKQAETERGKVTGTAVGCACGDGVIDWHKIVRRLKQTEFTGVLSVECGTEDEAIRSLKYLTKVFQEVGV